MCVMTSRAKKDGTAAAANHITVSHSGKCRGGKRGRRGAQRHPHLRPILRPRSERTSPESMDDAWSMHSIWGAYCMSITGGPTGPGKKLCGGVTEGDQRSTHKQRTLSLAAHDPSAGQSCRRFERNTTEQKKVPPPFASPRHGGITLFFFPSSSSSPPLPLLVFSSASPPLLLFPASFSPPLAPRAPGSTVLHRICVPYVFLYWSL